MFSAQQQNTDKPLVEPPVESISKIAFSPKEFGGFFILAVASWDNYVRLYQVDHQGQSQKYTEYQHDQPVFDLAWSSDGETLFSAGADNCVKKFTPRNPSPPVTIGQHQAPVKCVRFFNWRDPQNNAVPMVVSAGWDNKLTFWNPEGQNMKNLEMDLGDKAASMDVCGRLLVVAVGSRKFCVVNLQGQPTMMVNRTPNSPFYDSPFYESPLKWQTRVVSCVPQIPETKPNEEAFAIGSIEGRVSIQHPFMGAKEATGKNYSFKCHRYDKPAPPGIIAKDNKTQQVFAVNTIDFHPVIGTFVTGGADGTMTIWDGFGRTKVKGFTLKDLNNEPQRSVPPRPDEYEYGTPIVSSSFAHHVVDASKQVNVLAYAFSYDWSRGHQHAQQGLTKVMLRPITDLSEINRKAKR